MKKRITITLTALAIFFATLTPAFAWVKVSLKADLSLVLIPAQEGVEAQEFSMKDGVAKWEEKGEEKDNTLNFGGFMTHAALKRKAEKDGLQVMVFNWPSPILPQVLNGLYLVFMQGRKAEAIPIQFNWLQIGVGPEGNRWHNGYFFVDTTNLGEWVPWTPEFGEAN